MRIKILIILTISLMLIGGYYFSIVVFAESEEDLLKPLIVEVNTNINDVINYENYVIIYNDVNINKTGTYKITYKNIHSSEEVEKTIYVIDKEQRSFLKEELIYEESAIDDTYLVGDVFNFLNKPNCIYNFYSTSRGFNNYLNGEWNQNIHFNHTISLRTQGEIVDSYVFNNQLIMVGTDINAMNGIKCTCIYKRDTKTSKEIEITSEGFDNPTCVAASDKYYFIAGSTNKSNESFLGKREGFDSYVAVINRDTSTIMNISMVKLKEDDQISEILYYNDYLYLVQENNTNTIRLLKMDIFGNIVKEQNIDLIYEYQNPKFKLIDNNMYLSYSNYNYEKMDFINTINKVDENLEINEINRNYHEGNKIIDFEINNDLVFVLLTKEFNGGFKYLIYDKDNCLLGEYDSNTNIKIAGFGSNNVIVGTSADDKSLKYYKINSLLKVNEPENKIYYDASKETNNRNIESYNYYINGKKVKHDEKSNLKYDISLFGNYTLKYHFSSDLELYVERTVRVMPFVGALSDESYDLGLSIFGNGTLYVNNMLVENKYVFNEIGNYEIKLVGKDNEIEIYNISINDLSLKFKENNQNTDISPKVDVSSNVNDVVINKTFTEKTEISNGKQTSSFLYLIPAITLGIALLFFKKGA